MGPLMWFVKRPEAPMLSILPPETRVRLQWGGTSPRLFGAPGHWGFRERLAKPRHWLPNSRTTPGAGESGGLGD